MKQCKKQIGSYAIVILMALMLAVNYRFFIVDNAFAPAGINGIATMIQYKTGFSISYVSLIVNIPLCLFAYFFADKQYAVKSFLFTVVYSFFYLFLQSLDLSAWVYNANGHDTVFPVIISGLISGLSAGVCLQNNSAAGGTEIISFCIHKKHPDFNFFVVSFAINAIVAFVSLFVYSDGTSLNYKPVALCITYCFVCYTFGNYWMKGTKTAYKFTVVTEHPDEIANDVTRFLHHGVTRLAAQGAYTGKDKTVLLCVVNRHQLVDFKKIIESYPDTFSFHESVNETYGNFRRITR